MTCRTYYASCEYRGRLMRRKVGRDDVLTAAEARNKARAMLALMRDGTDPKRPVGETLGDAFETYLARRRLIAATWFGKAIIIGIVLGILAGIAKMIEPPAPPWQKRD